MFSWRNKKNSFLIPLLQSTLIIPTINTTTKTCYTDYVTSMETLSQKVTVNQKLYSSIIIQYFKQHVFVYLLELPH